MEHSWQETMESLLATDANTSDEEDMDFFNDDSSDEDSEASITEELLILALKATEKLFRWNEERLNWDVLHLQKPLDVNLDNAKKIILACVRLHNFIIENDQVDDYDPDAAPCEGELVGGMFGEGYIPTINEFRSQEGTSLLQQRILDRIE
jgi:hypothetical protein